MLSICIFGSQARRTADAISDRDVLLVGSPSLVLDRAVAEWAAREWNVSVFDRPSFERLANVKGLFIQHLKQEGQLLYDDGSFLASVLERYSPKTDYSGERNDALTQIVALPSMTGAYWHDLCLADVVYVLFRNAAILHMACGGEYCFHYEALIKRMTELLALEESERLALLLLRDLKHIYRRRIEGLKLEIPLPEIRRVVDRMIEKLPDMAASSVATGVTTEDYLKLRLTELDLVAQHHPAQLDILGPENPLFVVWQSVRSRGEYPKPKISFH